MNTKSARRQPGAAHADRLSRMRSAIADARVDAFLVLDRMDQYWLTGFTGEDGGVIVTADQVVLLTDGRFGENADTEAPYARKVLRKKRSVEETVAELRRLRARRVGFEPAHLNVGAFAELRKLGNGMTFKAVSGVVSAMRQLKDAGEIEVIRHAIDVAQRALHATRSAIKPGETERSIAALLEFEMRRLGADEAAFGTIVACGPNGSLPHYRAGDRKIADNDCVLVDWGARCDWYVSDLTRVIWTGSIPAELGKVHRIVKEAHDRAVAAVRAGARASAVDRAARQHIHKAGFGKQFTHSVGHAIGLNVHEAPGLRKLSKDVLKAGMVVTIEPGIYLPGIGGVRVESDVLVTANGPEVLSTLPLDVP
ncbi:MAG: Xaa-Pro peptidase family protein [Phycisphaerae bacterium]